MPEKGWRSKTLRACEVCATEYYPSRPKDQRFCSLSCAQKARHASRDGNPMTAAIATRKRQHNEWVRAMLTVQFGTISERELELFRFAYSQGYNRAHALGYYAGRKLRAA